MRVFFFKSFALSLIWGQTYSTPLTTNNVDRIETMSPNPKPYQINYEDGSRSPPIYVKISGSIDSKSSMIWEETSDGFTVKPTSDGTYHYLDVDTTTGDLVDTNIVARENDNSFSKMKVRPGAVTRHLNILNENNRHKQDEERFLYGENSSSAMEIDNTRNATTHRRTIITTGVLKNLVIPFKFKDHAQRTVPSKSDLEILMNNEGPHTLCPTGSVRDVYLKSSFNQLDITSTVADWVIIDKTEAECAAQRSGLDITFHQCLVDALNKVAAQTGINFTDFDDDGDGVIDGIAFFHSGYGAEWGSVDEYGATTANRIWSHKWLLFSGWSSNGVMVSTYHISPALWYISGSDIGRIGVVAHETGHYLGLPDLYDYGAGTGIGSYG